MGCGRSSGKDASVPFSNFAVDEETTEEGSRWKKGGKPSVANEAADKSDKKGKDGKEDSDSPEKAKKKKKKKKKKKQGKQDSSSSSDSSAEEEEAEEGEMTEEQQRKKAKKMVTDFTKQMVRGRHLKVMAPSGQVSVVLVSLARTLDALKVKAGKEVRRIDFVDVREIQVGEDVEGIETPVDELCSTLKLASGDAVTLKHKDLESRDTFVMVLLMFCQQVQGDDEGEEEEDGEGDEPVG